MWISIHIFRNLKYRFPSFRPLFDIFIGRTTSIDYTRLNLHFAQVLTLTNIDSYFCLCSFQNLKFRFSSSRLLFRLISYYLTRSTSIYTFKFTFCTDINTYITNIDPGFSISPYPFRNLEFRIFSFLFRSTSYSLTCSTSV